MLTTSPCGERNNGQPFSADGRVCVAHLYCDCAGDQKNSEGTMVLFLEIFCVACRDCFASGVYHVPFPHAVIRRSDAHTSFHHPPMDSGLFIFILFVLVVFCSSVARNHSLS